MFFIGPRSQKKFQYCKVNQELDEMKPEISLLSRFSLCRLTKFLIDAFILNFWGVSCIRTPTVHLDNCMNINYLRVHINSNTSQQAKNGKDNRDLNRNIRSQIAGRERDLNHQRHNSTMLCFMSGLNIVDDILVVRLTS